MLETLNNKNKPRGKYHIPALARMAFDAVALENDELILAIEANQEPILELEPTQDGDELIDRWNDIVDRFANDIDDSEFALSSE